MNDLFKVKAAFIVGLLATVFLFKPLVDSNSDFGFDIFHVKITVEHAYMFLTACLGLAVYLISLQFVSPKYFKTINSISDTCYLLALLTPLVFFVSWILMSISGYIGSCVSQNIEFLVSFIAGLLVSFLASAAYMLLQNSIKSKFLAAEKNQRRKIDIENIEILAGVKKLYDLGMYEFSILESRKIIESVLIRLLKIRGISIKRESMIELLRLSKKNNILNSEEISFLNKIRKGRDDSPDSADKILRISKELITKIDALSYSSGYEWLEKNRDKVIQLLKGGNLRKCQRALNMLREAWENRDGIIWLELAKFFEVALISNPELIINMFQDDEKLLNGWLESVEIQLFKDFVGGEKDRLAEVKMTIISQFNKYISNTNSKAKGEIARKILAAIEESEITEVE